MTAAGKKKISDLSEKTENEAGLQSDGARLITSFASDLYNCVVSRYDVDGIDKIKK